ncbi:MAG TPA: 2Fe-2S iron-sulfur cluster-binding protein [Candidatus Sphingobacterium stercoripullorum]|uniref:2Fe-2S iron-sulfur cluster binding domain-containing protein n=1 Tax=Candidatus Sphingobacterium stercoripullorum TaxID=2838759 RepID=A0A9D1WAC5_9SPHI|nr:2Fe-2S iron-sulfur cluster binding domain-containing protein [Candidatus Sphingobacterium stercoripullorum]HLR48995.1 2Fe-2S iron-sulfur cluster-binding protein [Candidatus Sphingobacterium stercoripullorum]
MENNLVNLHIHEPSGEVRDIQAPTDMSLSLMEILKSEGYPIQATCGGMALCATCHIRVLEGFEQLPEAQEGELYMLDTLFNVDDTSRLSCQIRISPELEGLHLELMGD